MSQKQWNFDLRNVAKQSNVAFQDAKCSQNIYQNK